MGQAMSAQADSLFLQTAEIRPIEQRERSRRSTISIIPRVRLAHATGNNEQRDREAAAQQSRSGFVPEIHETIIKRQRYRVCFIRQREQVLNGGDPDSPTGEPGDMAVEG